jgi:putative colanic acid biosynthesis glycosyltransferase WcaI
MRVLLLNQCFYPDVVSTAQHLTDLAVELADSGHEVTVITGDRGYDDADNRFPRREDWKGIRIIRIPSLALGKSSRWRRALNFVSFLLVCSLRLMFHPQVDVVVALTSPPLISFLGSFFVRVRGGRFFFWVMDLNPDEAIAAGWLKENSLSARVLSGCLNYSLHHSEKVIVLDRFMQKRIIEKGVAKEKLAVIAPWSHSDCVTYEAEGRMAFRAEHSLEKKYVVMYSGNHSPCHPLDTLLGAARKLADEAAITFCFVGGGSEYDKVKAFAAREHLKNVKCLPYQPLNKLAMSLSAADLHVVVMGNSLIGMVHPCKLYNILAIGSPVLYIGPSDSHVVDVLSQLGEDGLTCSARHGDVDRVADYILKAARTELGRRSPSAVQVSSRFAKEVLLPQLVELISCGPSETFTANALVSKTQGQSIVMK